MTTKKRDQAFSLTESIETPRNFSFFHRKVKKGGRQRRYSSTIYFQIKLGLGISFSGWLVDHFLILHYISEASVWILEPKVAGYGSIYTILSKLITRLKAIRDNINRQEHIGGQEEEPPKDECKVIFHGSL